jgi:hypothetical protein
VGDQVKIGVGVTGAQKVEDDFRRIDAQLEKTAALLSRISSRSLSGVDAGVAEHNFSNLRRVSSGVRGYSGLSDFLDSPAATLRDATARGRAEGQLVEHYLRVDVTNNGRTVSTSRLPLTARAPIAAAGITAP